MDLNMLSGVGVRFVALHREPFAAVRHGHAWVVWAYWPADEGLVDGLARQAWLTEVVAPLHPDRNKALGDQATNEGVAAYVAAKLPGCCCVRVVREAEMLDARVFVERRT